LLWVFSGRRGIHCWVSDEIARKLNNEGRTSVVEYVHLNVGNELSGKLELSYPLHPAMRRAYDLLYKKF
jgi:DNA primase small subunit